MGALIMHGLASDDVACRRRVQSFMFPEFFKGTFLVFFTGVAEFSQGHLIFLWEAFFTQEKNTACSCDWQAFKEFLIQKCCCCEKKYFEAP